MYASYNDVLNDRNVEGFIRLIKVVSPETDTETDDDYSEYDS